MNPSGLGGLKKKIKCNSFINPSLNKHMPAIIKKEISTSDLAKIIKTRTLKQIKSKIHKLRYNRKHNANLFDSSPKSMKDFGKCYLDVQDDDDQKYITLSDSLSRNKISVSFELLLDIFKLFPGLEGKSRSVTLNEFNMKELVARKKITNFYKRVLDNESR
jgi:hypothetical protein